MSKGSLALFNPANMPAHVQKFLATESNIQDRQTVPSLIYNGSKWSISINGETKPITKRNEDGDDVAMPIIRMVVVAFAPRRGRAYYEGNYDPAKITPPKCWSDDGVVPHASVKEKMAAECGKCPMSVKGSKVTEQMKDVAACQQHRMLVVVPANNLDFTPLRLKLAITSDWDGQNKAEQDKGWFGFSNYTDYLRGNGVKHTGALVTKMKFDGAVSYPKVLFSAAGWLDEEQTEKVAALAKDPDVLKLLGGAWTPAGPDGVPTSTLPESEPAKPDPVAAQSESDEDEEEQEKTPAKPAKGAKAVAPVDDEDGDDEMTVMPPAKTAKAPVAVADDEEEDEDGAAALAKIAADKAAKKKAKAEAEAKAAAAAKKAAAAEDDGDEDEPAVKAPAKAATKASAPKGTASTKPVKAPSQVASVLSDWDDD